MHRRGKKLSKPKTQKQPEEDKNNRITKKKKKEKQDIIDRVIIDRIIRDTCTLYGTKEEKKGRKKLEKNRN